MKNIVPRAANQATVAHSWALQCGPQGWVFQWREEQGTEKSGECGNGGSKVLRGSSRSQGKALQDVRRGTVWEAGRVPQEGVGGPGRRWEGLPE